LLTCVMMASNHTFQMRFCVSKCGESVVWYLNGSLLASLERNIAQTNNPHHTVYPNRPKNLPSTSSPFYAQKHPQSITIRDTWLTSERKEFKTTLKTQLTPPQRHPHFHPRHLRLHHRDPSSSPKTSSSLKKKFFKRFPANDRANSLPSNLFK
jgi:hypothetical protein